MTIDLLFVDEQFINQILDAEVVFDNENNANIVTPIQY